MLASHSPPLQRHAFRILLFFAAFTCVAWLWHPAPDRVRSMWQTGAAYSGSGHPVDYLIKNAQYDFDAIMARRTKDLHAGAAAYRERRGRHPPPGFDAWYKYAQDNDAVIVEDFFDQIYHDLNPFWGLSAEAIRHSAKELPIKIRVRNGTVQNPKGTIEWMNHWIDMVTKIQEFLPDLDMPVNLMDEPRLIVPWEDINRYVQEEHKTRKVLPVGEVIQEFSPVAWDQKDDDGFQVDFIKETGKYWDVARVGCAPDSPSRHVTTPTSFYGPPPISCNDVPDDAFSQGKKCNAGYASTISYKGYVSNWTAVKDACLQPELRDSHGSFVEPLSQSTAQVLIPHFGGSKLTMNNDILIPPPMYWPDKSIYATGGKVGEDWAQKSASVVWRGGGTGGILEPDNWTRFQRHRFVSLMNGSTAEIAEKHGRDHSAPNFYVDPYKNYRPKSPQTMELGPWLRQVADVGFSSIMCGKGGEGGIPGKDCPYLVPAFSPSPRVSLDNQYGHKYLPDIDGNSFSGRYLAFLRSTSVPIKATVYSEWHDSRLFPWIHFIPMHNSFVDIYGILDYFIGSKIGRQGKNGQVQLEGGNDQAGKKIAMTGKDWAGKVLRKEDMTIYVLRLLLEYGRLFDDQRVNLGFVGDLQ